MSFIKYGSINEYKIEFDCSSIHILVDSNTKKHCLPKLPARLTEQANIIVVKSGEMHKTIDSAKMIWEKLSNKNADRKALMICLGGGMVGDLGGFCAGTYKRGIKYIQIPTTLLSMVDSSIGNKTGIDVNGIKNLVGLFNPPIEVFIDHRFLMTLPSRQILNGYAEIIKHSLIAKEDTLFDQIFEKDLLKYKLESLIPLNIEIKSQIVQKDPLEQGCRKWLNFGHTIGHAIESFALQKGIDMLHCEAIILGMLVELELSTEKLGFSKELRNKIIVWIKENYRIDSEWLDGEAKSLLFFMKNDKKNCEKRTLFSLLKSKGDCIENVECDDKLIIQALQRHIKW